MKKIGRTVCQIRIGENNARNGEGSFLRLRDGFKRRRQNDPVDFPRRDLAILIGDANVVKKDLSLFH